jgi:hypothetical protein
MFLYRKLSLHPVFPFYSLRQKLTDSVDHHGGARIAYHARRAASLTPENGRMRFCASTHLKRQDSHDYAGLQKRHF